MLILVILDTEATESTHTHHESPEGYHHGERHRLITIPLQIQGVILRPRGRRIRQMAQSKGGPLGYQVHGQTLLSGPPTAPAYFSIIRIGKSVYTKTLHPADHLLTTQLCVWPQAQH